MDTKNTFIIYGLIDPRDGVIKYVGKSTTGLNRIRQHSEFARLKKEKTPKSYWIKKLISLGLKPIGTVLSSHSSPEELMKAEIEWIAKYRALGLPLKNLSAGGYGPLHVLQSKETKLKKSIANKRRYEDPQERIRTSLAMRGILKGRTFPERGRPIQDQFGNKYPSVCEAERMLKIRRRSIFRVLSGERKSVHGYRFTYSE
jgi:hypothetical protein